jgi:hypothetical protein
MKLGLSILNVPLHFKIDSSATILLSKEIHKDLTAIKEEDLKNHIWGF